MTKLLGAQVLKDLQTFVSALDAVFGGFRQRAEQTYRLLQAPGTAFVVVATPERDAMREASYFVERLAEERMPLAGLVVNRVHRSPAAALSAARSTAAAEDLESRGEHELTAAVLRLHAGRMQLAAREHREQEHFVSAHPTVPVAQVPAMAEDVHDLEGLRRIGELLAQTRDCDHGRPPCPPPRSYTDAGRATCVRARPNSAGDQLICSLVLFFGHLQQVSPGVHIRTPPQQRSPFALGHPAPHPELDAIVQRIGEALGTDRASSADQLRPVLGSTLNEQTRQDPHPYRRHGRSNP